MRLRAQMIRWWSLGCRRGWPLAPSSVAPGRATEYCGTAVWPVAWGHCWEPCGRRLSCWLREWRRQRSLVASPAPQNFCALAAMGSAAVGAPRALVGRSQLRLGDVVKPGRGGIANGTYWLTTSGATPGWHRRAVPASRTAAADEVPVRARRRHRPSDQRAPAAPAAADPAWSCANCRRQRCWSKT